MLVRQRTANPNPLLSSPSDNASSTPPLRLLSSSLYSLPPANRLLKIFTELSGFNFSTLSSCFSAMHTRSHTNSKNTNTTRITWFTASVNLSVHWFLWHVMCVCVCVCECVRSDQYWKPESAFLVCLWCVCLEPRSTAMTYWLLNASTLQFTAPQTLGRGRVLVSGCCSPVPGRTGGSFKGILETSFCFIFLQWDSAWRWENEGERAHYVLFVGKPSPLNFLCYVLSLTPFLCFSRLNNCI